MLAMSPRIRLLCCVGLTIPLHWGLHDDRTDLVAAPRSVAADDSNVLMKCAVAPNGDLLLVPVRIGGRKYDFLVDTGSSFCCVDSTLRRQLVPTGKTARINDREVFDLYEMPEVFIGNSKLRVGGPAVCADLAPFRKWLGHNIRGFLGMSVLRAYVLQIDFDAGVLAILRSVPRSSDGALDLAFDKNGIPKINLTLPMEEVAAFDLDTGLTGGGTLDCGTFNKVIESGWTTRFEDLTGILTIHGEERPRKALIRQMALGQFRHLILNCHEGKSNALGLDALSRYVVTFDFPNNRLYLQKGKRFDESVQFDMSGIALSRAAGATVVEWTGENSPSANSGVREGDRLLKLDGRLSCEFSLFELHRRLSRNGEWVRLVVRGNDGVRNVAFRLDDWQDLIPKLREASNTARSSSARIDCPGSN